MFRANAKFQRASVARKVAWAFLFFAIIAHAPELALAQGKVTIRKRALTRDPSLSFLKNNIPAALSTALGKDFHDCGWFDTTPTASPDITISAAIAGKTIRLTVTRRVLGGFTVSAPYNRRKTSDVSAALVDRILKKLFDVPRLCQSKIAFCAKTAPTVQEILICGYNGSNARAITRNHVFSVEPDWEPGQKRLVYSMYGKSASTFVEYDLRSKRSRHLASFPGLNAAAAISPDGQYLAAVLSKDGEVDLYVKSINTKWLKRLTRNKAVESSPCWSPSGGKICFVSNATGKPRLYIAPVAGGKARRLPTFGTEALSPDWSTKNQIVYSAKMGPNYALALLDINGATPPKIIISAAGDWESPSWAPDARHVVATRTLANGQTSLYVIDTWTGKAKRILLGKAHLSMPSW